MNEITRALVVVGAVTVALAITAVWAFYRSRSRRGSLRTESLRPWPAVVVFTSTDCDACGPVRDGVFDRVEIAREIAYQGGAEQFRLVGIDKVPTVVMVDRQGIAVGVFEGHVSSRQIGRGLRRAGFG